ncbi:MAG: nucleoside 2-deoxyribosyltransferase [Anaerolineales bacterium]
MNNKHARDEAVENKYSVYAAGGIFTQHDLTTNVLIKDSVWKQSKGKFELVLPQSKELRDIDRPDIAAYIRNVDLVQVVKADLFIARFDGLELDAGTVIEFMLAKFLGKPTVIIRCDSRRLGGESLDEPYNLMVKNWPRTIEIHFDSLINFVGVFAEEWSMLGNSDTFQTTIEAEYKTVMRGIDGIAQKLLEGLEIVLEMESPYPDEFQEFVYEAIRYSPGSGFEELLSDEDLAELIQIFREKGTL